MTALLPGSEAAFGGLTANTKWYNVTIGMATLIGRFFMIIPMLAIAGSLGRKKRIPPSPGTFPVTTPLFSVLLVGVIVIVGALTFFAIDGFVQYRHWNDANPAYAAAIGLAAVGLALTMGAGFLGWKMVQKHHVGIDLTPEQRRLEPQGDRVTGTREPAVRRA